MSVSSSSSSGGLSKYEIARNANIARNLQVLQSLGLRSAAAAAVPKPRVRVKKPRPKQIKRPRKKAATAHAAAAADTHVRRRKSRRLSGLDATSGGLADDWSAGDESSESDEPIENRWPQRPEVDLFGALPGIACGFKFDSRADACTAGVHRATVAGIVGKPDLGCFSIVLNGGYADDLDEGEFLTYTGSGGRSLKGTRANPKNLRTGKHTKNQTLEGNEGRYNRSLQKSVETGKPVRVIRGYKLESQYAPLGIDYGGDANYRYDGLYRVQKMWSQKGCDHPFQVFKFALVRLKGQPPLEQRNDL